MTPEERAAEFIRECYTVTDGDNKPIDPLPMLQILADKIAVKLRATRLEALEEAAKIADDHPHKIHMEVSSFEACAVHVKDEIASAIRERAKE